MQDMLLSFVSNTIENKGLQSRFIGLGKEKRPCEKAWTSKPPNDEEAIERLKGRFCQWTEENGEKKPPVYGLGIRLGSHTKEGEPFPDGCLIAIDCDIKDDKETARAVLNMFLECAGKEEKDISIRYRDESTSWACLVKVPGLIAPKKEQIKTPKGAVEFLGQGQQLAACYQHSSGKWPRWTGGKPEALEMAPEALERFKARLCEELGAERKRPKNAKTGRPRALKSKSEALPGRVDRLGAWLLASGRVLAVRNDGAFEIACPWAHEHATDEDKTGTGATTYLPITYPNGGFDCKRSHLTERTRGDLIEWAQKNGYSELTEEELALYERANMEKPDLPFGYFVDDGWIWREGKHAVRLVKMPFSVYGIAREETRGGEHSTSYSVEGIDGTGEKLRLFIPREWSDERIFSELLKKGFQVERFKGAASPIASLIHKMSEGLRPQEATARTGWAVPADWQAGDALPERLVYVLPGGECIEPNDGKSAAPLFLGPPRRLPLRGTVESWRDNVGALLRRQSKALVSLSVVFFAPVARLLKWPGLFFFLTECSSGGKTTILEAVASVTGGGVKGANATANALQDDLEKNPDWLRTMDELTARKATEIIGLGYLANGHGRERGRMVDGVFQVQEARPVTPAVLGTGEKSLETQLNEAGGKFTAGQEARVLSFPANAKAGFGCFSHVDAVAPGLSDEEKELRARELGAALSKLIRERVQNEQGAVGRAWVQYLADHPACLGELKESARAFELEALEYVKNEGEPSAVGARVIGAFAQLFACLDLANRCLDLRLDDDLRGLFKIEALAHLQFRDLFGESVEARLGRDSLSAWLFENGASFKRHSSDEPKPCLGWRVAYSDKARGPLYAVPKGIFEQKCKENGWGEPKILLEELAAQGLIMESGYRASVGGQKLGRAGAVFIYFKGAPNGGLAEPGVVYTEEECAAWGSGFADMSAPN